MEKEKVVNKGYTLKIVSWENDADNYKTIYETVETKEEAAKIKKFCDTLLKPHHQHDNAVGNTVAGRTRDRRMVIQRLEDFIDKNPEFEEEFEEAEDEQQFLEWCLEYAQRYVDFSDFYLFRVCQSCTVTYSPKDIYVEKINF